MANMPTGTRPALPAGTARVAILGTSLGHKWANVFYLQLTHGTVTTTDLQDVADFIATSWNTNIAPLCPTTVILTNVQVVFIPTAGSELTYTGTYTHAGTSGNASTNDASAALVVNWNINAYYRGGHPRWYLPGVQTNQITNGSDISSAFQTSAAAAFLALKNAIDAHTTTNISAIALGTLSFQTGNAWRTTPVFRIFAGCTIRPKLGSQRRRILS